MPRKKLNPPSAPQEQQKSPEKFFYPELLEEAKLLGDAEDYYAIVYRITNDGTVFEGRTRADATWEDFRDTFGPGKYQFQVKHRATNAYAGQHSFRIGSAMVHADGGLGSPSGDGGGSPRAHSDISALVRSLESLIKPLVQPKRSDVEEMLLKFAINKLTEKQEPKSLASQIEELLSLQKLIAPKSKETDLLEAFDKRLNLVERVEQIGKKIGSLDGDGGDEFTAKDMIEAVKMLIESSKPVQAENVAEAPQISQQPIQPQQTTMTTPDIKYQNWLSEFPSAFRKGADMIAKAMVSEANHDVFIKALKAEASDETGAIKQDYQKFVKVIKIDADIAIDFLKSKGFPVAKHLDWTNKALQLIAEQL